VARYTYRSSFCSDQKCTHPYIEEVLEADGVDYVKPLQGITPARSMGQLLHGLLGTQCNIRRDTATPGTECTGNRVATFFFGQLPPILWLEFNSPETRETHSTKRLLDQKAEWKEPTLQVLNSHMTLAEYRVCSAILRSPGQFACLNHTSSVLEI